MGLKTTNYEIKELGITLPEAYAILKNLRITGERATAEFAVQSTRENALTMKPLVTKRISFDINRNENPLAAAYIIATGQKEVERFNLVTHKYESTVMNMPFYGWTNDIVTEAELP